MKKDVINILRVETDTKLKETSVKIALVSCLISACAIILVIIVCFFYRPEGAFVSPQDIITYVGLAFSIAGVVATVFFVVLSYRAGLIYDNIKTAGDSIQKQMEIEKKVYQELVYDAYEALCDNYSRIINDCPEKVNEYELTEARMACKLFLLPKKIREEKIRLISDIGRDFENLKDPNDFDDILEDINNDSDILEKILYDEKEEKDIRKAANESLQTLKELKEKVETKKNTCKAG